MLYAWVYWVLMTNQPATHTECCGIIQAALTTDKPISDQVIQLIQFDVSWNLCNSILYMCEQMHIFGKHCKNTALVWRILTLN